MTKMTPDEAHSYLRRGLAISSVIAGVVGGVCPTCLARIRDEIVLPLGDGFVHEWCHPSAKGSHNPSFAYATSIGYQP